MSEFSAHSLRGDVLIRSRKAVVTSLFAAALAACGSQAPNGQPNRSDAIAIADLSPAVRADAPSTGVGQLFTRAQFGCAAISYPSHWRRLTSDEDLNLRASTAARGFPTTSGRTTLLLLNAMPEPHGAQIRVTVSDEPQMNEAILLELAGDHETLVSISDQLAQGFNSNPNSNVRVLQMRPATVVRLAGHAALLLSYDREGMLEDGPWRVDQYKIPLDGRLLQITASYRTNDGPVWSPILASSLASIDIIGAC